MSSFFDGRAEPGETLVLIQGDVRLRAVVAKPFEGGPGHRAALELYGIEVISGKFPSHVEELTINANGWQIFRKDDPRIPKLPAETPYSMLIEALEIFRRYGGDQQWLVFGADEIHSGKIEGVSFADQARLRELGWYPDDTAKSFFSFV